MGKKMLSGRGYRSWLRPLPMAGSAKTRSRECRGLRAEEGSSLVEMAIASSVFFVMFIGLFELCLAFYSYHFVSDAAREATRYAMVRGATCSTNTPSQTNCNVTSAQVQSYIRSLGYPGLVSNDLTSTTTWCAATSSGSPATTTWSACAAGTAETPGNEVKVVVNYAFPLHIPFWKNGTINVSSTSFMVIAQ